MRTIFLTILTGLFFISGIPMKIVENDLIKNELKGKVKSVRTLNYFPTKKQGDTTKTEDILGEITFELYSENGFLLERYVGSNDTPYNKELYKYDNKDNLLEKQVFDYEDSIYYIRYKTTYKYNEKRQLIEMGGFDYNGNYSIDETYKYDGYGNKVEVNEFKSDGSLESKSIFKYDEKGKRLEKNEYHSDGKLCYKLSYFYDYKNNLIEENVYYSSDKRDEKGNVIPQKIYVGGIFTRDEKKTFKYDKNGNKIESTFYDRNGNIAYKYYYIYDKNGNEIVQNGYSTTDSLPFKCTSQKYDKHGNLIEKDEYIQKGKSNLQYKITYTYDLFGNEIEVQDTDHDKKYTYKFNYDIQRNWTNKTGYNKDEKFFTKQREIEYYK